MNCQILNPNSTKIFLLTTSHFLDLIQKRTGGRGVFLMRAGRHTAHICPASALGRGAVLPCASDVRSSGSRRARLVLRWGVSFALFLTTLRYLSCTSQLLSSVEYSILSTKRICAPKCTLSHTHRVSAQVCVLYNSLKNPR